MISDLANSYKLYLEVKYPSHWRSYCTRLAANPEGARAEAVVFSFLRSRFEEVKIAEDITGGGADFLCVSGNESLLVEVTSIASDSVVQQSNWENKIPEDLSTQSFGLVSHMLRTKVSDKAAQVSGYPMPRILVVTTEHIAGNVLLGPLGASSLLTSETKITIPIGEPDPEVSLSTDLKDSVFFRWKNGIVEPCRRSISAILLAAIYAESCLIIGILHPEPVYILPISVFRNIPFCRLKKWPPENHMLDIEWVIHSPNSIDFYYMPIMLKDSELRTI